MRRGVANHRRSLGAGALLLAVLAAPAPAQERPDTVELPELEVTAASRLPEGSRSRAAEVLGRIELERLPVRTVSEALRWAVGVDLQPRSGAQADVSLRGGSFEQVLVLVDGVPMSDAQTGHFDLDLTVPLELVERIEVVRGPASSVYGADAMGGVINVVTRKDADAFTGSVRAEGGSFGSWAGSATAVTPVGDGWRLSASAERDESDGHRDGVDHEVTLAHANVAGPVAGGRLLVSGGWAARDFGADGFYAPFPSYEETRSRVVSAGWTGPLAGAELEVRAFTRAHDDDFILRRRDPSFYRNVHEATQRGAEATVRLGGSRGLLVALGGQVIRDDLESTNLGDRTEDRGGVHAEAALLGDGRQLRAGVRVEGRDGFGTWVAPSASGSVDLTPRLRARAGVGRSYRTPTFTERYYTDPANVGRADLEPESAWSVDAGVDWAPAGAAVVRATVFRRTAEDLIDWARPVDAPAEDPWETRNVESATFSGLELAVDGVEVGSVTLEGSATFLALDTEEAAGFESKVALRPLTRNVMVGARNDLGLAEAWGRVRWLRREGGEAYQLADVGLSTPARWGAELWVEATNVLDEEYPDITGLTAPGRAFRLGTRIPLG